MPLSDYHYTIAKRKRENVPAHVQATPTGGRELTLSHLSQKGLAQERVRAASERAKVEGLRMGEEAEYQQNVLDDTRKDLGIATGISLANLGLTGYGTYRAVQRQNELDARRQYQTQLMERVANLQMQELENRANLYRAKRNFINFGGTGL